MPRSVLMVVLCMVAWLTACSSTTVIDESMMGAANESTDATAAEEAARSSQRGDRVTPDPDSASAPGTANDTGGDEVDADLPDDLTELVDSCEAGSDPACDLLFQASALGSVEEATAETCGGRRDPAGAFCTDGIEADGGEIWFADTSPGLQAVVADCEAGDMISCDFLYFRSAVGSDFEEIGSTCAGRTEVALPDCRRAFPE